MTKRAVVVGINDYTARWPDGSANLTWCVNDAQSMYHLLVDAFGFDASQIYFYTDQQASRRNILRALRNVILRGEPGDVAAFYYSGHGGRVPAAGGHGDSDLQYETICPASGDDISDWEIAEIASDLEPSYVNFTCLLDSCHSGGMHVADAANKPRSLPFSEALLGRLIAPAAATLLPVGLGMTAAQAIERLGRNVSNLRRSTAGNNGMIDLDADPAKTLISQTLTTLISGCNFDELSWESTDLQHGLLTRSLIDLVNECPFTITYHDLMDELRSRVGSYITSKILPGNPGVTQVPQLYGQANRMTETFLAGWSDSR